MKHVKWLTLVVFTLLYTAALANDGRIKGKMYYDYSVDVSKDGEYANEFSLKRLYFGYSKQINDKIKFTFTSDVRHEGGNGKLDFYMKYANVSYQSHIGTLIIGVQKMNIFSVQKYIWGYRFIEKTAMNLNKWSSSADLALGFEKKIKNNIHFSTIISNGTGYKKAENDGYKKFSFNLNFGERKLAGKNGYSAGVVFALEPYEVAPDTVKGKVLMSAYAGISQKAWRIGGEIDFFRDWGIDRNRKIYALYFNYNVKNNMDFFGRVDYYDPDQKQDNNEETLVITGINVKAGRGFYIAPNFRFTFYNQPGTDTNILFRLNFLLKY